jgi:hypothetical protein
MKSSKRLNVLLPSKVPAPELEGWFLSSASVAIAILWRNQQVRWTDLPALHFPITVLNLDGSARSRTTKKILIVRNQVRAVAVFSSRRHTYSTCESSVPMNGISGSFSL